MAVPTVSETCGNPVPSRSKFSRFPLEKWTHILVYSASSGAEQSTPFAVRIADVSSSISGLTFVDKAGKTPVKSQFHGPNAIGFDQRGCR